MKSSIVVIDKKMKELLRNSTHRVNGGTVAPIRNKKERDGLRNFGR
ncbi:hypothetical protein KJA15_01215 [Patescibacteria group bacterium]|nr:hypothetical protein [Patescibacteria group bacterium]